MNDDDETVGELEIGEILDLGTMPSSEKTAEANEDPLSDAFGRAEREKKSIVHKEMTIVTDVNGIRRRKCNWCGKQLKLDNKSFSTSSGVRDLLTCAAKKRMMNSREKIAKQTTLGRGVSNEDQESSALTWQYDHAKVRELASHVIMGHEYPFTLFEGIISNKMLKAIYPWYKKIDCELVFKGEKPKMKASMSKVNRIGLTTDLLWSSEQKIGYMTVIGHYIDSKWQLHRRVLSFINVPPPHTGVVLAKELIKVMDDWAIKDRVVSITVDNASANDKCIKRLKEDFSGKKNLLLRSKLFHVRCCAHILNLLVKDGLSVIQDSIEKIRGSVKYLVSSERKCKEFNKIRMLLGLEGKLQVLDNNTMWNSTWLMLSIACYYKICWPRYAEEDPAFSNFVPTEFEWETVEEICQFLGLFAHVTEVISGSYYPTVNLFINEPWKVKTLIDENVIKYEKSHLRSMAFEMQLKYDKYWSECDTLIALDAIHDPRYKMAFVKYTFPELCGMSAQDNLTNLQQDLETVFKEYERIYKNCNEGFQSQRIARRSTVASKNDNGKKNLASFLSSQQFDNRKSNLDYYLEEHIIMTDPDMDFNILQWWRANEPKYPVLSKMAKDILTILVGYLMVFFLD